MNETLSLVQANIFDGADFSAAAVARTFDAMDSHHADYADVYVQHGIYESWQLEEGMVKAGSFATRRGFGVRAVSGEKTAFAYADSLNNDALMQAARAVRTIGKQGQQQRVRVATPPQSHHLYPQDNPITGMDAADKVALLHTIDALARAADRRVTEVQASLAAAYEYIWLARRDGRIHADIRPLLRLSLNVIVEENGRREQGNSGGGGRVTTAYFDTERITAYVTQAVAQAILNLSARPAPAGEMTVVLGSGWPGVLLHEAVGHGLEGDFNRKGTSVFSGRIGERVAARGVTVIDQGNLPLRRGSLNIDDEGNATRENILIEDGILRAYLQDETNARLMKTAVTGNGRRESYAYAPMPRMTNTFMQNGTHDPQEIIASVKKGIYAANFGGGQVDITAGQFVFSASEAWLIENGKLIHPVKGATLIGNGAQTLKHISMIGNDSALDSGVGVCGKDGQSVPVGVGQPTLRIDAGLTVGGSQV
ncbi:MAG: metalloprotease TldD [Neisseria sp.]|nr:metalloprotease TldD [Neisseria sp.]